MCEAKREHFYSIAIYRMHTLISDNREFWSEVKKLTEPRSTTTAVVYSNRGLYDNVSFFAQEYSDLYSTVSCLDTDMTLIDHELANRIHHEIYNAQLFEVIGAIDKLKPNRRDGCNGLSTNSFKYASYELFAQTASLF